MRHGTRPVRAVYTSLFLVLSLAAGAIYYAGSRQADVVVARTDLLPGTRVSETDLAVRQVAAAAVPVGAVHSLDEALGQVVAWPVLEGQYLTHRALARDRAALIGSDLDVPAGLHAISLAVTPADAAGGAIRPGDRVDVIAVPRSQLPGMAPVPASVIGAGVLVLGLRTDQGQPMDTGAPMTRSRGLELGTNRLGSILLAVAAEDESRYAGAAATSSFTVVLDL